MALILNGSDTSAGDDAGLGYTAAEGLILTGQGTTSDVTIKNDADTTVFSIPTGTDDILFPDGARALFGAGSDLALQHDGSNSYIQNSTGNLNLQGKSGENGIVLVPDGAVTLYYDNAAKLATASGGVNITSAIDVVGSNFANVEFTGTSVNGSGVYTGLDSGGGYVINVRDSGLIGFSTSNAERMRIDASGNLLVGTTNTSLGIGNTNTGFQVENTGTFLASRADNIAGSLNRNNDGSILSVRRSGTEVGTIGVTASTTSYNTSSDYRLKENVSYTFDATTRLKQLKPARFNFISDDTNTLVDGFIAHEVSSVVPEAITGAKDAVDENGDAVYQGIDQSKLVPLLVKTIQEQQTVIEALEARITALEGS